jgi:hypothetical protein
MTRIGIEHIAFFEANAALRAEFLRDHVMKAAWQLGWLPVYVDFSMIPTEPERVFLDVLNSLTKKGTEPLTERDKAFKWLEDQPTTVLLILNNAQCLTEDPSPINDFACALRSIMYNRPMAQRIPGIFAVDSQSGLDRILRRYSAPFFESAVEFDFPSQIAPVKGIE